MEGKTFEQLFAEHLEFTTSTFPKGTSLGALLHAEREIVEARQDIEDGSPSMTLAIEIADVFGCIVDAANRSGVTPDMIKIAFENKLAINKSRKWKDNGDSSYSHIK